MKHAKWVALLLLVTLIWGASFSLVKENLETFGTFAHLAMRFLLASILLFAYLKFAGARLGKVELVHGAVLGGLLFLGYGTQTLGLNFTSATNSAFITGLYVIGVPVLSAVLLGKMPERKIWAAALLAAGGLFLLTGAGIDWNSGDLVTLATAGAFSLHIVYTAKVARECEPMGLAAVQLGAAGLISALLMVGLGEVPASYPIGPLGVVAFLAIFASAFAMWVQSASQKVLEASRVALIFIGEPVFAALTAVFVFGEGVGVAQMLGAGMILMGMIVAEWEKVRL